MTKFQSARLNYSGVERDYTNNQSSLNMVEKTFDEVVDSLGEDGLKNVVNTLDTSKKGS